MGNKIRVGISQPPFVPVPFDRPILARHGTLDQQISAAKTVVPDMPNGALAIPDRVTFEALASRDDVPGALGVREVKFVVIGVDTDTPMVFFMNSKTHVYHAYFVRDILNVHVDGGEFTQMAYFRADRKFLAGTIIAHDNYTLADGTQGLYALEFWPTDPVGADHVTATYNLVHAAMPFAVDTLAYHPSGAVQEELFADEADAYAVANIATVSSHEIFESIRYSPLNLGVGIGYLRVFDPSDPRPPSITDFVIYPTLPNDLPHIVGVISEEPQTPLSHVNLRSQQNGTPNAYLHNASTDPILAPYIGKIVKIEVTPDGLSIREAETSEMERHLEDSRPQRTQDPQRVLSRQQILPLDVLGHRDIGAYGGKSANVAELRKFLSPELVPNGFGVPFYFYDRHMTDNGLYDLIGTEIAREDFQSDNALRNDVLKDIRKAIKKADIPADLRVQLGDMHAQFPAGTTPRCRSSANNEDLIGFTGAGLYDSYTHREDEGHIEKSIKQVWASLWTYRAFEERNFYRIDHFTAAMGVLVHPNFDDELVNGVALTKNIYFPNFEGYYVNAQVGEDLVTNPEDKSVAEEFLAMHDLNRDADSPFEIIRIRKSNLIDPDRWVMERRHRNNLIAQLKKIHTHFAAIYGRQNDNTFGMDVEFKVTRDDQLSIKQARPWVD